MEENKKHSQEKAIAINQLISSIVGLKLAKQTEYLNSDPINRLEICIQLTINEYSEAISLQSDCVPDANRMISQVQKRLDRLNSLSVLLKFIN